MFNYDAKKGIVSITTDPLEFDIDDLVETVRMALGNELSRCYSERDIESMDYSDYNDLCNLVFEKAKS